MAPILWSNLPYLLQGAVITIWLSLIVVTLGTLLGAALGVIATSVAPLARGMIDAYIFVLRGIPVLVVMLIGYYTFPALGFRVNAYVAVASAQIIYISAFVIKTFTVDQFHFHTANRAPNMADSWIPCLCDGRTSTCLSLTIPFHNRTAEANF